MDLLMFKLFRTISLLEGCSYLAILSVSFGFISRDFVSLLGMAHGILFILYLVLALTVSNKQQWSMVTFFLLFIASIVPLAFIGVEIFLSRQLAIKQQTTT